MKAVISTANGLSLKAQGEKKEIIEMAKTMALSNSCNASVFFDDDDGADIAFYSWPTGDGVSRGWKTTVMEY